jgi:hypothetical protein
MNRRQLLRLVGLGPVAPRALLSAAPIRVTGMRPWLEPSQAVGSAMRARVDADIMKQMARMREVAYEAAGIRTK